MAAPVPAAERGAAQDRLRWGLLSSLVRKELAVRYQGSVLGFVWSLAHPLLLLGIYYVVFVVVFANGIPDFHVYVMSGLLAFTAFSGAVGAASTSVVSNAGLVKKVRFPLLVLPCAGVGFAMVQLALQLPVLLVIALVSGVPLGPQLLLLVPALALLVLFATALGILTSAVNVRYRDTSHFVEVALLVWFWLNPVLYAGHQVRDALQARAGWAWDAYFLNPVATVVSTFQRAVYAPASYVDAGGQSRLVLVDAGYAFYLRNLAIGFAISAVLLVVARRTFSRLQGEFADDL